MGGGHGCGHGRGAWEGHEMVWEGSLYNTDYNSIVAITGGIGSSVGLSVVLHIGCVCVYHIHTRTHTHLSTHMRTPVHTHTHTHLSTHLSTHPHTHTYPHTCAHLSTHTHTHTPIHTRTHTPIHRGSPQGTRCWHAVSAQLGQGYYSHRLQGQGREGWLGTVAVQGSGPGEQAGDTGGGAGDGQVRSHQGHCVC